MIGREVLFRVEKKTFEPGATVLELKDVCALDDRGPSGPERPHP